MERYFSDRLGRHYARSDSTYNYSNNTAVEINNYRLNLTDHPSLTDQVWVVIGALILSFVLILFFAGPVGEFIFPYPALKILALTFLVTMGVTIFMEGMHEHVPKA